MFCQLIAFHHKVILYFLSHSRRLKDLFWHGNDYLQKNRWGQQIEKYSHFTHVCPAIDFYYILEGQLFKQTHTEKHTCTNPPSNSPPALDVVGLPWLTQVCNIAWTWQCRWIGRPGWWSFFLRRGTRVCVSATGGSHSSSYGPALQTQQGPCGCVGVCPTSPYVVCGLGKVFRRCPWGSPVVGSLGSMGCWVPCNGLSTMTGK